jgi:hypothetical protein
VLDVPPKLSSRVRLLDNGRIGKTDPNDSRSAAIVALRNATLNVVTGEDTDRVILTCWRTAATSSRRNAPAACAACTRCCAC